MESNKARVKEETGVKTTPATFRLPTGKVKIRPILRSSAPFIKSDNKRISISERTMLTGTSRSIICPTDGRTGRFIDPFTEEERIYLENALSCNLDVNKITDNYLDKTRITIYKQTDDIENTYALLDKSVPSDYVLYKIALIAPEVANKKMDMYTAEQLFYIDDEEIEVNDISIKNDIEDVVFEYILSIKNKRTDLFNLLKTFNLVYKLNTLIPRETSTEVLYNKLKEYSKDKRILPKLYDLITSIKDNPEKYSTRIFIQNAMDCGEVSFKGGKFVLTLSGAELGNNLSDVEFYFNDAANQLVKEKIKGQISVLLK